MPEARKSDCLLGGAAQKTVRVSMGRPQRHFHCRLVDFKIIRGPVGRRSFVFGRDSREPAVAIRRRISNPLLPRRVIVRFLFHQRRKLSRFRVVSEQFRPGDLEEPRVQSQGALRQPL